MAKKATKSLALTNRRLLNTTHLTTLMLHLLFHTRRLLLSSPLSLLPYTLLTSLSLALELFLERAGRPTYNAEGTVLKSGDDLGAPGLTEWMWDVIYWTWGTLGFVTVVGRSWAWWVWIAVPLYSAWLGWSTVSGMRQGLGGMMPGGKEGAAEVGGESNRQKKMERRGGGGRVAYR